MNGPARSRPDARVTDVVVIGGGPLGAATAWWLARSGAGVVLLEEGTTRDLRLAARGTAWTTHPGWPAAEPDLLAEAVGIWREVEGHTGAALLTRRDALDHGTGPTAPTAGGIRVAPGEAARRWPGTTFAGPVLLRPGAAWQVRADHALAALTASAVAFGAVVRHRSPVTSVEVLDDGRVEVRTPHGTIRARRAVVTGPPRPVGAPGIELHFPGAAHPDLPVIAHHDPELGLLRAARCAQGHLAVGAGSWPRGTLGDLRAHVRGWWAGAGDGRPEPVGPDAMSTVTAEVTVVGSGPLLRLTTTALGSVDVVARAGRLADDVLAGGPATSRTGS